MKRNPFRVYLGFARGYMASSFAYKYQIIGWTFSSLLTTLITCILWFAIYDQSSETIINGFNFTEMLTYVVTSTVVMSLTTSTQTFFDIGEDIRMGNIAITLTKPVNYRYKFLADTFGSLMVNFLVVFLPLYTISLLVLHFGFGADLPTWYNLIFFAISALLSCVLLDAFNFLLGQLVFFTGALFGLMLIKDTVLSFLSGGMIPLVFLPQWIQNTLRILPFSSLTETPIYILLNKYEWSGSLLKIAIQIGWVIVFEFICYISNKTLIKHVTSVGG